MGATLTYGVASLAQYGDTVSGIYFNSEGFSILFRMDLTQMVLAIPVTYAQLIRFVVFSVVVLLILAPIRLGGDGAVLEHAPGAGEAGVRPVLAVVPPGRQVRQSCCGGAAPGRRGAPGGYPGHRTQPVPLLPVLHHHPLHGGLYHHQLSPSR